MQFSIVVFTYFPSNYKLMYVHFIQFSLLIWIQQWLELNENKMIAKSKLYKSKSAIFFKSSFLDIFFLPLNIKLNSKGMAFSLAKHKAGNKPLSTRALLELLIFTHVEDN